MRKPRPTAIVELGAARRTWGLPGAFSYRPSLAVELTPIKDWLEIEAGVSPLFHGGRTEWDADLLFKKPFTLSDKLEFMVGIGPQWTFARQGTQTGAEFALDFMFWPTQIENTVGSWSRHIATLSAAGMSNRSAPPSGCSFRYRDRCDAEFERPRPNA